MSISALNLEVLVIRWAGISVDCLHIPLLRQAINSFFCIDKRHSTGLIHPPELVLDSRTILVENGEWNRAVCDIQ